MLAVLDHAGLKVRAAFWLYLPESNEWRLYLALPMVSRKGPKETYSRIRPHLDGIEDKVLSLKNISVVAPNDRLVKLLGSAVKTGPGIGGIRFTGNVIDNVLIEDAYIYRVA